MYHFFFLHSVNVLSQVSYPWLLLASVFIKTLLGNKMILQTFPHYVLAGMGTNVPYYL